MYEGAKAAEDVIFSRGCEAVLIPDGLRISVPQGTVGVVTQVLGGNFTVQVERGFLVRLEGRDADAIGLEPTTSPARASKSGGLVTEEEVWEELRSCYDPEIPVNIVELGLVYACQLRPQDDGNLHIDVQMTLTAPGCGMGQILTDDVEYKLRGLPGVSNVQVDLVFDPPWSMDRMSEAARLELGFA